MSTLFLESPTTATGMMERFEVAAFSKPARTFTGDFYYTHRAHNRLWFAVGDVAGKGLPAAVIMAMIQEELEQRIESCASAECDPSTTIQRLHLFMRPLMPSNRFATMAIGHLRDDGLLTLANAGHCPPLIVRPDGVEALSSTGPVAGILPRSHWTSVTRRLALGETLFLYSDGLLEAPSASGEEFGLERIVSTLRSAATGRVIDTMLTAARKHSPAFEDDVTLLAITA